MGMDLYEIVRILTDQKKELEKIDVNSLCPRREESQFELESPLAQVVIGVRRAGKSMLCHSRAPKEYGEKKHISWMSPSSLTVKAH